jgi:hypothetical protein
VPLADHKRPSSRVHRRLGAILAVSAALLFTAACSGSDDGDPATGNPAGGTDFVAYQNCLKENGVTLTLPGGAPGGQRPSGGARPSGQPGGDASGRARVRPSGAPDGGQNGGGLPGGGGFAKPAGVDDATWEKAQTACSSLRPSGQAGRGANGRGQDNGISEAYRTCLSDHGVTLAGGLNTADPAVAKAIETCEVLQPSPTPTS